MDKKDQAFKDWKKGVKQNDIAEKYGVSVSAVKSWVNRDFKTRVATSDNKKVATKNQKVATSKRGKGGQKSNQNAKGNEGKSQPHNQNNFRHGAYAEVYWDTLDEDELAMIEGMSFDEENDLEQQIALLTIRERRLLMQIQKFRKSQDQSIDSTITRDLLITGSIETSGEQNHHETTIKTSPTLDIILKLETTLTQVQARKTQCIASLHKIRSDRKDRAEREREREEELGTNAVEDVVIYLPEKRENE